MLYLTFYTASAHETAINDQDDYECHGYDDKCDCQGDGETPQTVIRIIQLLLCRQNTAM